MKLVVLPRVTYQVLDNTKPKKETYFDNVVAINADSETLAEWDSNKTDYKYLDEVKIEALHTKYTAVKDNPKGHPASSTDWFGEGLNAYRLRDKNFTTSTVFSTDAIVEYATMYSTLIFGLGVDNCKEILIEYVDANDQVLSELSSTIDMSYIEVFECESCCNPPPTEKRNFTHEIKDEDCEVVYKIRATFKRLNENKPLLIATSGVGYAHHIGCAKAGMTPKMILPSTVDTFTELGATGIRPANIRKELRGSIYTNRKKVDDLTYLFEKHGAWLNLFVFDEVDEVKSAMFIGRMLELSTPIYRHDLVEVPIEAFGILT